jgi:polysaccharide chain length determinant protein (PEP-CTERM system associated)
MEGTVTLAELLAIIKRRKLSIVIPAVCILTLAILVAVTLPRMYRSTSTILIEDQEVPRDYVTTTVTGYADQRLQSINQRIMSTPKLLEIINKFNLYKDLKSTKTTEEIVDRMRKKDIKFETISADVIDPRTGQPRPATIAFSVSYKGNNPAVVQQVANVLATLYLEENLRVREQQTMGTSSFMQEEMKLVQDKLAVIDTQITAYKQRNLDSLPELSMMNVQGLDNVDRDLSQLNDQMRTLREREGYLVTQLAGIPTEELSSDRARLAELRARLLNLRTRVSDEYPDVIKLKSEISAMEQQIRSAKGAARDTRAENQAYVTLSAQLAGVKAEIDGIKRQIELLKVRKDGFRKRIDASPRVEEGIKGLLIERNNLQVKYDDLNRKYMESKVAYGLEKGQKGERFTLIDAARLPEKPISPNMPAIILIGMVLGIGSGVGLAALREFSDHAVRDSDTLVKLTGVPVLAVIPEIMNEEDMRGNSRKWFLVGSGAVALVVVGIGIFHFLIMDLDIFWAKLMRKIAM